MVTVATFRVCVILSKFSNFSELYFLWYIGRSSHCEHRVLAVYHQTSCRREVCVCMFLLNCSVMSHSLPTHGLQPNSLPFSMRFSKQEYWSGLPFPPPGGLTDPGMETASPESPALAGVFFITGPPGKPIEEQMGL